MNDLHKQERLAFIASLPTARDERLAAAKQWLRERNRYALDRGSRTYTPVNGHTPQAMVELRTRLG